MTLICDDAAAAANDDDGDDDDDNDDDADGDKEGARQILIATFITFCDLHLVVRDSQLTFHLADIQHRSDSVSRTGMHLC